MTQAEVYQTQCESLRALAEDVFANPCAHQITEYNKDVKGGLESIVLDNAIMLVRSTGLLTITKEKTVGTTVDIEVIQFKDEDTEPSCTDLQITHCTIKHSDMQPDQRNKCMSELTAMIGSSLITLGN